MSDANTQQRKFYSLSQVAAGVRKHLENAIDKRFWLRAEISSGRERQGAFFGELVETDDSGKQVAKMQTRIWSRELSAIRRKFQQAGLDLQLEDGTEVGIFCSLQYDARYGLFLKVHDADPAFALGELELRRREILLRLENDGLFEPNKQRTVPLLPQRIGVITSRASAAFNDFGRTFEQSRFGFTLIAADAVVQGRQAEPSVIAAIDALVRLHVELIVIIRGGGSKTDLAYLDNDAIARTIARCPIPVWTGIGHETDTSVLDFVANQQFKTPTAVAVALVDRFSTVEDFTDGATARLRSTWQLRFKSERESLARNSTGLKQGTRKMLDAVSSSLEVSKSSMTQKLTARLTSDRDYLVRAKTQLVAAPQTALRVGAQYLADAKRRCRLNGQRNIQNRKQGMRSLRGRFRRERYLVRVSQACESVERERRRILSVFTRTLDQQIQLLHAKKSRFQIERVLARLKRERDGLETNLRLVRSADPVNSLQRGYSLSYDQRGQLVKSVHQLEPGEELKVVIRDGSINSTVDSLEARQDD